MSDAPQGPGWWQASDGKWYPPQPQQPPPPPAATGQQAQVQQAPQGTPGRPVYVAPVGNGLAVAALVLGILAVLFGLIPLLAVPALVFAVLALIFGFTGRGKAKRIEGEPRKGMATAGIVLGGIGGVLSIIGFVIVADVFEDVEDDLEELDQQLESGTPSGSDPAEFEGVEITECSADEFDNFTATVEVTNNSSERSDFQIEVVYESGNGSIQYASSLAYFGNVAPGQTVSGEEIVVGPAGEGFTCRVVDVDRTASF